MEEKPRWHSHEYQMKADGQIITLINISEGIRMVAILDSSYNSVEESRRNARLIAAAPELLEALEAIKARIHGEFDNPALIKFGPLGNTVGDILQMTEDAIRKAEGK